MSSSRGIFKNVVVTMALVAYIVVSILLIDTHRGALRCTKFSVIVLDSSKAGFVCSRTIDSLIVNHYGTLKGRLMDSIDFYALEELVESQPYVAWSDIFYNSKGEISVKLTQRAPLMRLISEGGYDFYVDSSLYLLQPTSNYVDNVPLVSGNAEFSFPATFYGRLDEKKAFKDMQYIKKLINFVQFISRDDFLRGFVMQIYVSGGAEVGVEGEAGSEVGVEGEAGVEVSIMPRIGTQVVRVGNLDSVEQKMLKAKSFYLQCYGSAALDSVSEIDVSYQGQIITR